MSLLQSLYLFTIAISLYTTGWLLLKAERNRTALSLALCQVLILIWCAPQLFAGYAASLDAKYLIYRISYLGIIFIGPAWLEFAWNYCETEISHPGRCIVFLIAAIHYLLLLLDPALHYFYRSFELSHTVYGTGFYLHAAFSYLCIFGGLALLFRKFHRKKVPSLHRFIILLSVAIPLILNIMYIFGVIRTDFDVTPTSFSITCLLMLLVVFRYDFLDIQAMTFAQVLSTIAEGVAIYDLQGKQTYCNESAAQLLGKMQEEGIVISPNPEPPLSEPAPDLDGQVHRFSDGQRIRLRKYPNRSRQGNVISNTWILTDVTEYYELLSQAEQLEESGRRLAVEQERNRIAQEVHDTTGHTLTMIQSLLRLIRAEHTKRFSSSPQIPDHRPPLMDSESLSSSASNSRDTIQEQDLTDQYLTQAQQLVTEGIRELRQSIHALRQSRDQSVTEQLRQLTDSIREIEVELSVIGEDSPAYQHLAGTLYSCLRESITNCLKYAQASHMDVILKFETASVSLYIFDDGKGCSVIQDNNGLRGIRERVQKRQGTVRFLSAPEEGFQTFITLPLS